MPLPANDFIFSPRYRLWRHLSYWTCYVLVWACYWSLLISTYPENIIRMLVWIPVFATFSYPIAYIAVPKLLLKGRFAHFVLSMIIWGVIGFITVMYYKVHIYHPVMTWADVLHEVNPKHPGSFLCMTTTAGCMAVSSLTKRWILKQQQWMRAEKEKISAELQVLKAQLHPHFLFNTLNNIYSFSLQGLSKTPGMILKLSSMLSYMLYDCKADEVSLEKEVEVMKNYIDLEKERYGDKIDISVNVEGDIPGQSIAPLLILPFLENAFKHGTSEQLDRPWLSVDVAVKDALLKLKVVNSKNEITPFHDHGVGINNVKKRLQYLYPGKHELKIADEGDFFVVSLLLELKHHAAVYPMKRQQKNESSIYETTMFAGRR